MMFAPTPLNLPFSIEIGHLFLKNGYFLAERAIPPGICAEWKTRALALSHDCARSIRRDAPEDHEVLRYSVVTGGAIKKQWPELFSFYANSDLKGWVETVTGAPQIVFSSLVQSAININVLARPGDKYRWHFDAVPYTVLLYLSNSSVDDGGALEFYPNAGGDESVLSSTKKKVTYFPQAGEIVLMDGTRCYHRVAPILRPHLRISIPMVFPCDAEHSRPADLDSYLYQQAA